MAGAFGIGLLIAAGVHAWAPHGQKLTIGLDVTARWSFLWFWLATVSRPLEVLVGSRGPWTALAQRARDFGLAFASAHLVHLSLVAYMLWEMSAPFPRSSLLFFGFAALTVYLLALLSWPTLSGRLDPRIVRLIRVVGVEYISYAFILDFIADFLAKNPRSTGLVIGYLPFQILALSGPLLRLAALIKRLASARRVAPTLG